MIKNIIFDMGNVLLRFDRDYFLDAVGVQGADRRLLLNNVYLSLEWAKMDRGSMTEAEAAESMCRRLPQRLHKTAHLLIDRWDRPILPIAGMEQLVRDLKKAGYGVYLLSNASYRQHEYWPRVPGSQYFDGTLISADVKLVKPEAEIYRSGLSLRSVCLLTIPPRTSKAPNAPVCRASSSTATQTSFAGRSRPSAFRFRKCERTAPGKLICTPNTCHPVSGVQLGNL